MYGNWRSIGFKVVFLFMDFFVYMDGHPQATVVLFPRSLVTQGFKEATMGNTVSLLVCLFSCSTECSKRRECCIYGLSPWRMALVGLMHNLSKMMVISSSAGDARLSWRCQLSANACVQDIQDILRIPHI